MKNHNTDPKPVQEEEKAKIAKEEQEALTAPLTDDGGGPLIPTDPLKPQ